MWFEQVDLRVRGAVAGHLDSLIEPFTLPDLPVVVWFVDGLPTSTDPLLAAADVLVVDARELEDAAAFRVLVALSRQRPVVDLSWVRLQPWRQLLAGLFEGPAFGPFVHHVHLAEVWGRIGPRHLLAGWLADRLGLEPDSIGMTPAEHVGLRLHARQPGGSEATFEVLREGDARVVSARAEVVAGPRLEEVVNLPDASPAWGLAEALTHLGRDPLYDAALRHAAGP